MADLRAKVLAQPQGDRRAARPRGEHDRRISCALCCGGLCCKGVTEMHGVKELRVKETDRIDAMAKGLRAAGVSPSTRATTGGAVDGPWVTAMSPAARPLRAVLDHRIAMAFLMVIGMASRAADARWMTAARLPRPSRYFESLMGGLGCAIIERGADMSFAVAIDGPAAAGKGTISKAVAAHFGFAHLDTGLLYRAVGAKVLGGRRTRLTAARSP